jgi:hypothetical protein
MFNHSKVINLIQIVRFEVFTAVRMMIQFFWVSAPCRLVDEEVDSSTSLHGAETQKNSIFMNINNRL